MVNIQKLHRELAAAGLPVISVRIDGVIDYLTALSETERATAAAIIAAHDPTDYVAERQAGAQSAAAAIPSWATWDESQVIDYINTNVTTLASAKVVLVAMARMLVALRNQTWPGLKGEGR
jgi:hypothetical protein